MNRLAVLTAVLVLLPAGGLYAAEQGLVAHWSFDEGRGTVARDRSGNGNDGVVHDAKWVKNKTGYCLEFDGQTSWVDCGSGPSLDLRAGGTLGVFDGRGFWVVSNAPPRPSQRRAVRRPARTGPISLAFWPPGA